MNQQPPDRSLHRVSSRSPSRIPILRDLDLEVADPLVQTASETLAILCSPALYILSPSNRARFVLFGKGPSLVPRYQCVHHAFIHHAMARPHAIAAEHLGDSVTFLRLDQLSNRLASRLTRDGIGAGKRVCLLVQRSIAMLVGILGILKAGASYIPLDGGVVTDIILRHVVSDSKASLVLHLAAFEHRTIPCGVARLCLDNFIEDSSSPQFSLNDDPPAPTISQFLGRALSSASSCNPCKIGTTGKPKGVSVTHSNISNLLGLSPGKLGMRPGARVSQLLSISFDMCAWEVLGSLSHGCTLCIRGASRHSWTEVLKTVDIVIATPTILQCYQPSDYPNIRCVATAGEPCSQKLADTWAASTRFYNACGPTETTIVNTMQRHQPGNRVLIGRPTPNNAVYILNKNLRPCSIGETGIMWAAGAGISAGYVNHPDLTSEKYVDDPFLCNGRAAIYAICFIFNTGDLGRWTSDGGLEHLGRIDDQVKIKGFRVELDGVAAVMEMCPGVTQACAIRVDETLLGFVCPRDAYIAEVRLIASTLLPYYAVPSQFLALDCFPVTSNGKTDKSALRDLYKAAYTSSPRFKDHIPFHRRLDNEDPGQSSGRFCFHDTQRSLIVNLESKALNRRTYT
ncbi:hypothetical protein DFH09DRAFT_1056527 [Mycena vulgaris]|nr:hypothetical protein DFH09DRAFT_1056527 [Mycena vulgaris]